MHHRLRCCLVLALLAYLAQGQDEEEIQITGDAPVGTPCKGEKVDCFDFDWGQYEGEHESGVAHGEGVQTFTNGDKYKGWMAAGKRNGEGTYMFKNGDGYMGEFFADQRHGWGQFFFKEKGFFWEGEWNEGKQAGQGFVYFSQIQQGVFTGTWEGGEQKGELTPASHKDIAIAKQKFLTGERGEL